MNHSEDDLRAALRDGEGRGNPRHLADEAILNGGLVRARRRTRLVGVAAAVLVLGGIGTGIGFAVSNPGHDEAGSSAGGAANSERTAAGASAAASGAAGETSGAAAGGGGAAGGGNAAAPAEGAPPKTPPPTAAETPASRVSCRAHPPAAGTRARDETFGDGKTLFPPSARTIVICAYRGGAPTTARAEGATARALGAIRLPARPSANCDRRAPDRTRYQLIGPDSTVTIAPSGAGCFVDIGPGRYIGPLPAALGAILNRLSPP
jgi:hypothetical protein